MTNIKSIFISAILISALICLETSYNYDWVSDDCENGEITNEYASLYFFFNTNMENGIPNYRIGPMVNVPCNKLETFMLQFEVVGMGGTINNTDTNQGPVLYNASAEMTMEMDLGDAQEHIENNVITMVDPVVKATVDIKLNKAVVTFHTVNKFMLENLESYGIEYNLQKQDYEVSEELKANLSKKIEEKTKSSQVQVIELDEAMKQEILSKLIKGQNNFTETKGNQNIQITVQRKLYKQNPDGSIVEIDKF